MTVMFIEKIGYLFISLSIYKFKYIFESVCSFGGECDGILRKQSKM